MCDTLIEVLLMVFRYEFYFDIGVALMEILNTFIWLGSGICV